ncbi:MAG: aspartate kinase [Sphaerochaetaceae bacterium]|nr:aspartate kinase [Sphaerochaetaceae bacterium]
MIVSKFGGSSLCDAAHIRKVAEILKSDESRQVAVVSAPGKRSSDDTKITDRLYRCEKLASEGKPITDEFEHVRERYLQIAQELALDSNIGEALDQVYKNISEGAGPHYAASRGEYLNGILISEYLGWKFIDAQDVVIIEDDGTVADETYELVGKAVEPGFHYIVPGFFGRDRKGIVRTFSRGGSDISGAIVARAIGADIYENWTDVSGISKADPRIVKNAQVINKLTYSEVRELAAVGFNVFHEDAIAPVREAGIPIQVKNTNRPQDEGTSIVASRDASEDPVVGISAKKDFVKISVHKLFLLKRPEMKDAIEKALREEGYSLDFTVAGIDDLTYFAQGPQSGETVASLLKERFSVESSSVEAGFAVAAVTGEGLSCEAEAVSRLFPALLERGLSVEFVNIGASPVTALFGIRESEVKEVIHTLYDVLFS